jgi:hypothetical protein
VLLLKLTEGCEPNRRSRCHFQAKLSVCTFNAALIGANRHVSRRPHQIELHRVALPLQSLEPARNVHNSHKSMVRFYKCSPRSTSIFPQQLLPAVLNKNLGFQSHSSTPPCTLPKR